MGYEQRPADESGVDGVNAVVSNFLADLDRTMGLTGCASPNEVDRDLIVEVE